MTPGHKFVVDDAVLEFFSGRSRREREELLRIWRAAHQCSWPSLPNRASTVSKSASVPRMTSICLFVL